MTLNIWNYNDPWPRRRDLIVEAVSQVGPDVIGFQEIRHDGALDDDGRNQAEQLAERLSEYRYIHQPAQPDPEADRWEGLAIFSRLPIASSSHVLLSRDPDDPRDNHQRIVLCAELQTPAGSAHFFNTHLSLSRAARSRTVREISAFTSRYPESLPHVLVGDFNETPDSDPVQHLLGEGGFSDTWVAANGGDPGCTFDSRNPYAELDDGGKRIDYIFMSTSGLGRLVSCRRVADRADTEGHLPSDHYGLAAEVRIDSLPSSQT
jgi:endonuclease/exonuclease/phosphatase family metal-dependent hydrolase